MKIALFDLETNGLDPYKHEILEIGMVLFDSDTLEVIHEISLPIEMEHPQWGDEKAYALNGWNAEAWRRAGATPIAGAMTYIGLLLPQDTIFAAWNATFDWTFFSEALRKTGRVSPFHYRKIDVLSMMYASTERLCSLREACEHFKLPQEPAVHRALEGARAAFRVYKAIIE